MSDQPLQPKLFIDLFDEALVNLDGFKPIEKMALRGCITEILAKYYQYMAEEKPSSSVIEDVKKALLCELLSIEKGIDIHRISKLLRAYNSKVPVRYSLKSEKIVEVYQELIAFNGKIKAVK